jgi:type III pantothenate kinase
MLLAVDIGNTNVTLGVFEAEELHATWRIATDAAKLADEYGVIMHNLLEMEGLDRSVINKAVLASVVPSLTPVFESVLQRYFSVTALRVGAGVKTGLRILYEDPREVGADRIVDAVAALRMHRPPLIIIDIGTTTVLNAVSREGDYLGGAIAPGIGMAADVLAQRTAMLRRVELVVPKQAIGTNTAAALQSGILFGFAGLIESMVGRFKQQIGADAWVIATGGWSNLMSQVTKAFDQVDENLTLTGLRLVYEMNSAEAEPASTAAKGPA